MSERKDAIRDHLARTRAQLLKIVRGLDEAAWEQPVQSEEGLWTARNVLAHLAVSEAGQLTTLKGIADGGPGVPETFDLNRYNNSQVQKRLDRTPAELLAVLEGSRAQVLSTLETMPEEQLDRVGRHASGRMMSVEQIYFLIGHHERAHGEEIARAGRD